VRFVRIVQVNVGCGEQGSAGVFIVLCIIKELSNFLRNGEGYYVGGMCIYCAINGAFLSECGCTLAVIYGKS
jgi:hypothetical protein